MRRLFVGASKAVFNAGYRMAQHVMKRRDEVVFLSRQANEPSYDFETVATEFERRGWKATMHLKKVTKRNVIAYAGHVVSEIGLLARCRIAILDRYDPVVSLIDFKSARAENVPAGYHDEFPLKPTIIQLWHAFGAFKKFGYQSIGVREGHSAEVVDVFNIHRNYSWVVCSSESARPAFSEAFAYPIERVVALDRPEYDELLETRKRLEEARKPKPSTSKRCNVLMAPTLRKSKASTHPFRDLYAKRTSFENRIDADVMWSFHPLEEGLPAPGNASEQLLAADVVVTDYSSIAYEAYLLGKPTVFFIPDIEEYRVSPGLNADPLELSPGICATSEDELVSLLEGAVGGSAYSTADFDAFAGSAFALNDRRTGTAAQHFVDFAIAQARTSK